MYWNLLLHSVLDFWFHFSKSKFWGLGTSPPSRTGEERERDPSRKARWTLSTFLHLGGSSPVTDSDMVLANTIKLWELTQNVLLPWNQSGVGPGPLVTLSSHMSWWLWMASERPPERQRDRHPSLPGDRRMQCVWHSSLSHAVAQMSVSPQICMSESSPSVWCCLWLEPEGGN